MNQTISRRRRKQENRIKLIAVGIVLAILITYIFNIVLANSSIQGGIDISDKGYITVTVEANDTLWTLAQKYMNDDYYDIETYVNEVVLMNHIQQDQIFAGEQLLIPIIK